MSFSEPKAKQSPLLQRHLLSLLDIKNHLIKAYNCILETDPSFLMRTLYLTVEITSVKCFVTPKKKNLWSGLVRVNQKCAIQN